MKITNKVIETVVSETAGEDVLLLVNFIKNRANISEFKIASGLKREINEVRNMLYRLLNFNLVSFTRKKDKKKGWYIYYWTFNVKRVNHLFIDLKRQRLSKLEERIGREESNQFYSCPKGCIRLDFEQATNFEFRCPECGTFVEFENNKEKIDKIRNEIDSIKKELKSK